jgi:hypothetical protein
MPYNYDNHRMARKISFEMGMFQVMSFFSLTAKSLSRLPGRLVSGILIYFCWNDRF